MVPSGSRQTLSTGPSNPSTGFGENILGEIAESAAVRLPDLATIFSHRAERLNVLAPGHELEGFLRLIAALVVVAVGWGGMVYAANNSVQGAKKDEGGFDGDAPTAILIEASSGSVLFEKNADELRAPSSMMKLMTAEVVFHDSLVVLSSAKNPLTRRRKLTLVELMDEPWALQPADSFFSSLIDDVFRANGHQPPRSTVATLSEYMKNDLLATGRFLTVLPGFMLKMRGRHSQLKALPVALPNARMPIGIITLKNRTLTPLAQIFIEAIRATAKSMAAQ